MDPSLQPLLDRLDSLSEEFRELREGVRRAILVAELDPEMALTRARKVLEHVIREVYERRIKEPAGTRPLENLLQRLVKDRFLPDRLDAYANTIRKLGNVGTHTFGEKITVADVNQSLSQLTLILEWYFEYERPGEEVAKATGAARPAAADGGRHAGRPPSQAPTETSRLRRAGGRRMPRGVLLAGLAVLMLAGAYGLWVSGAFRQAEHGGAPPSSAPGAVGGDTHNSTAPEGDIVAKVRSVSGIEVVAIPAGQFDMGSDDSDPDARDEEKPRHRVTLSHAFYLGKYKVTVGQFRRFVQANPTLDPAIRAENGTVTWDKPGFDQTDQHPVVCISAQDADAFCQWLAKETGAKVRLPTEAEWEYSCRAGRTTRFYFGDNEADLGLFAWYNKNINGINTQPCGQKLPNPFGLYDMHGLACEWCADGPRKYVGFDEADPTGQLGANSRVFRGGAINTGAPECRAANRRALWVFDWNVYTSFRVLVSR